MSKRNRAKFTVIALTLVCCLAVVGIAAYFTDGDTATNTFTVGSVSLDLQEPSWDPPTDIVPEQEIPKDPQIENDGINEEYVFLEVIVPYANVVTANDDGTVQAKAWTELFSYDVKDGWYELEAQKVVDETAGTVTHLYAWGAEAGMTALEAGDTTESIFDWVKFANVVEDEGLEGTTQNIVVNAYGIQTTNINDGKTALDGANDDGVITPAEVWAVVSTQAPSTDVAGEENANTDVKG